MNSKAITVTLGGKYIRLGIRSGWPLLACHEAGITVTLLKPQTSGAKSDGRFGKQDFVYLAEEDAYRCPAGEQLP